MVTHMFFDLDNTFYDYNHANDCATKVALGHMSSYSGIGLLELNHFYENAKKEVKLQQNDSASSHSRLLYFKRMNELIFNETKIKESIKLNNIFWTIYLKNMSIFPAVKKLLAKAKDLNIITIVATNLTTDIQLRKLVALGIDESVDYVITSEDVGSEKPSAKFVDYLKKVVSYDPKIHQSWFIGDDLNADLGVGLALDATVFIRKGPKKLVGNDQYSRFIDFSELCRRLDTENVEVS